MSKARLGFPIKDDILSSYTKYHDLFHDLNIYASVRCINKGKVGT